MFSFCFCFLSKKKVLKKFLICSYFLKKIPLIFRKWNFLIFWERHIQNHGIFRARGILRTLPNIYDEIFFQKKIYLKPKLYKIFFIIFFCKTCFEKVFYHCLFRCFHFTSDFYFCFSAVFIVSCIW